MLRLEPDQIRGVAEVPVGRPPAPPATALVLLDGDMIIVAGRAARLLYERLARLSHVQD
ncbi:hypothetical protein [uncultured Aeromicrobium sp.]|uniref:hypothetical protein n=1 Tax=uncultured Aeromicrobium sp. TaxID=337820 RepID=UPI0025FC25FD|nr:hypothetical protein [uncultured Aeromicrobium sp.]